MRGASKMAATLSAWPAFNLMSAVKAYALCDRAEQAQEIAFLIKSRYEKSSQSFSSIGYFNFFC
jgi:hypothetical protein